MYCIIYISFTKDITLLSLTGVEISHQLSIEQYSSAIIVYHGGYERYRRHSETGPHYDYKIGNFQILPK